MKILAIETSCDETAISLVEASGDLSNPSFKELSRVVSSQINIHREYGGVVPNLAKREHQKNLVPVLKEALKNTDQEQLSQLPDSLPETLSREPILFEDIQSNLEDLGKPDVDYIAVTTGPGLEPALWAGINFAKALSSMWDIPALATNHMEGHIMSPLLLGHHVTFPAVALLISGGHTELVQLNDWQDYTLLGMTRDDAVGEAFDKVARMLGLPYPGGPEISKQAPNGTPNTLTLPRPMIDSEDLDFSFSGLKTAVKYYVDEHQPLREQDIADIAQEFQQAATEVIVSKTNKALKETNANTLIVGGGVIANTHIRNELTNLINEQYKETTLLVPDLKHCGDNASMIAAAAYIRILKDNINAPLVANGSETLSI